MVVLRTLLVPMALAACLTPSAAAQDLEFFFADRWNVAYQRMADNDGDSDFDSADDVSFLVNPTHPSNDRPIAIKVTIEDGLEVGYWIPESQDRVMRGVDVDHDGTLTGFQEITVFRDVGLLDGTAWPQDLTVTDDGAVWWISGLALANELNGLARCMDLNGDGDAADPGEQVLMVDGNGAHFVEHDEGSTEITGWALGRAAAAGNGVMVYGTIDDQALFLFEDLNEDGDVLDAGESILLVNATTENPDLPMNPDFADGTFRDLTTQSGWEARLRHMGSQLEGGQRAYYFASEANGSPTANSGVNLAGEGLNFLIYRGMDGNGDRDINDAGEVTLYFNGSHTDFTPNLWTLRGLDVQDGRVYAVGLKPYPILGPGPNGNTWIHGFEDLNGDGDAMDPGEQEFALFDLQAHGVMPSFPIPPWFGNVMSDPWGFDVAAPVKIWSLLGTGLAGTGGLVPRLSGSGGLEGGTLINLTLSDGLPFATAWLVVGASNLSAPFDLGILVPSPDLLVVLPVGADGSIRVGGTWPTGIPSAVSVYYQYWIEDLQAAGLYSASNGLVSTTP